MNQQTQPSPREHHFYVAIAKFLFSYISLYKTGENPKDKKQRGRQKEWLLTRLEKYHEVFSERIRRLDAGDWVPDENGS